MVYEDYDGDRYVNPKCPDCRHCVYKHFEPRNREFYCVKCQNWFSEREAQA